MKTLVNRKKLKLNEQSGFTLIEILIVVILLGILATIIIPQVSVSSDDAKLNTLRTNLSNHPNARSGLVIKVATNYQRSIPGGHSIAPGRFKPPILPAYGIVRKPSGSICV